MNYRWIGRVVSILAAVLLGAPVHSASSGLAGTFAGVKITSALVIGNGKYTRLNVLANPANDAAAVAAALSMRGIPVTLLVDADLKALKVAVAEFQKHGKSGGTSIFYYSGHGGDVNNRNCIFPIDVASGDELLSGKGLDKVVPVDEIYKGVKGNSIFVLDTDIDPAPVPDNIVLAISGSPQHPALDNYVLSDGTMSRSSPYTASLVEMAREEHQDLPSAFLDLSRRVGAKTNGSQLPWVSSTVLRAHLWTNKAAGERPRLVVQTGFHYFVQSIGFSPDGRMIASAGIDTRVATVWDVATGREVRTLAGHSGWVTSVAFSPDGRTLATGSSDKTIKLWDIASGWQLGTLAGHADRVSSVAFSPDGKTLASASIDRTVRIWDVASLRELRALAGHADRVNSVAFSPDGKTLASGSNDQTVKVWNAASGKELLTLIGHSGPIWSVAFSPDGKILASGSSDRTARLWELATGRELRTLSGHSRDVRAVAFSPDGMTLVSGSWDKTIKRWDAASGKEIATFTGHSAEVWSVALSPDGKTLLSGGADWTIRFWDVVSEKEMRRLAGRSTPIMSVAFSPDGKNLASASAIKVVNLWDLAGGREFKPLVGHGDDVAAVAFSHDGKTLASGGWDTTVRLWGVADGQVLHTLGGTVHWVLSTAFSPDGKVLASGSTDTTVKLWDVAGGRVLHSLAGHHGWVTSVSFSPDGKMLATGSSDKSVILWDLANGRVLRSLNGHTDWISDVAFSPDGKTLATGSIDKTIKLWDIASGRELRTLAGHLARINSIAFSPDGNTLVSASADRSVRLWGVDSGRELYALTGHSDSIDSVAFSLDGKTLATGSADKTIKVWDVATRRVTRTLAGHSDGVRSISLSADGRTLASGCNDDTVKLWDLATGREIRTLTGHKGRVFSVAFSPDTKTLASASGDSSIKLWTVANGQELHRFTEPSDVVLAVAMSPDGKTVASASSGSTLVLLDAAGGPTFRMLMGHTDAIFSVAFSPDGRTLATGSMDKTVKIWDVESGKELHTLAGHSGAVSSVAFSPDGKSLASGSDDTTVRLWDVASGRELQRLQSGSSQRLVSVLPAKDWDTLRLSGNRTEGIWSLAFSPDGKTLAAGSEDRSIRVWDVAAARVVRTLSGHTDRVSAVDFSPDGKTLASGSDDKTIKLWRLADGAELATLMSFPDGSWALTDSEGRYDSSKAGNNPNLHWVVGLTPIALDQLKDRYYEPGLLAKVMGYNSEPLRSVPRLEDAMARLYPQVEAQMDNALPLQLQITLHDQGGGFGKVRVRLNGKEISADARDGKPVRGDRVTLVQKLPADSLMPAGNIVDVVAWNADGNLSSAAVTVKLAGTRGARPIMDNQEVKSEAPTLYAIIVGVANFRDPSMNLTFAGKDAHDFAEAVTLGADRLFGADRVQLHLLSDYQNLSAAGSGGITELAPSRQNLQDAFAQVAKEAKPTDILVVFLAGHGVMSGGTDGDYYYLTNDAGGLQLTDPSVRKLWGVSSAELTDWIKPIHANKQMMVLDTCSSGGALEKLTLKRAVPSSQIVALDRLKDRTGFYVLAGAAADRVSYETSRFGQGLLTRALLTGMKGAALRDGEFVDVAHLFQYARDEVPKLAREIGGIQAPLVAAPTGDSFDIGQMLEADQRAVPLAAVREMMEQSTFQDEDAMADVRKLSARFNQRLRAENAVTARGQLVFVDSNDFPDAWRVAGRYQQTPQGLKVTVRLFRDTEPKGTLTLTLTGDDNEQVEQLFGAVMKQVGKTNND